MQLKLMGYFCFFFLKIHLRATTDDYNFMLSKKKKKSWFGIINKAADNYI